MSLNPDLLNNISVRLAENDREILEAQKVRYQVFYEEYGATPLSSDMAEQRIDLDLYDPVADHLVVLDHNHTPAKVVGTYRLVQKIGAEKVGRYYTSHEFNIDCITNADMSALELGRSCVLPQYRTRPVLQLLWEGIASYITEHDIDLMFGCASFHTTDVTDIANELSYMYHYHLSPHDMCPRALDKHYIDMNILPKDQLNARRVFASLPPIIKGYLRVGGTIGDGAVLDEQFKTIDVCVIVQTHLLTDRYRKHYERKMQKAMPGELYAIQGE